MIGGLGYSRADDWHLRDIPEVEGVRFASARAPEQEARSVKSLQRFHKRRELLQDEILCFHESDLLDEIVEADLMQVRSYNNPPFMIEMVLGNVHCLLGLSVDWPSIQRSLRNIRDFISQMRRLRPEAVKAKQLLSLRHRLRKCHAAFAPKAVGSLNKSCEKLCRWVNIVCWRVGELRWLQNDARELYTHEAWNRRLEEAELALESKHAKQNKITTSQDFAALSSKSTGKNKIGPRPESASRSEAKGTSTRSSNKQVSETSTSERISVMDTDELVQSISQSSADTAITTEWQVPPEKQWVKQLLHAAELDIRLPDALTWVEITGCTEEFFIVDENAADGLAMHLQLSVDDTSRLRTAANQLGSSCPSPGGEEVAPSIVSPAETWARRSLKSGSIEVPDALLQQYGGSRRSSGDSNSSVHSFKM